MSLDATATALAGYRRSELVDTIDLLGACLLHAGDLESSLQQAGFGTYDQLRRWVPEYPLGEEVREAKSTTEAPAPTLSRLLMRLIHLLLGRTIRSWVALLVGSRKQERVTNFTPESEAVWQIARSVATHQVQPPDLLEALSVGPGTHRWYVGGDRRLLAAIARSHAGRLKAADRAVLAIDWPSRAIRRAAASLWRKRQLSLPILLARAAWSVVAVIWLFIRLLLGFASWLALAVILLSALPFALIIREMTSIATSTKIRTLNPLLRLGGSVEVTAPAPARKVAAAVLLPRLVGFVVGVIGLTPLTYALLATGRRPLPAVMSRPEHLARETAGFPEGPLILVLEATLVHGFIAGFFILGMLGLLLLAIPTPRETELAWIHLNHGVGKSPLLGRVIWPLRMVSTASESVERLFFWGVGPVYAAAGLVPVVVGLLLSSLIARGFL